MSLPSPFRRTTQRLAPGREVASEGGYDLYPAFPASGGRIDLGFDALAARLPATGIVACDGYAGVFWDDLRERLDAALRRRGIDASWVDVAAALKADAEVERLVAPFLGGDDPLFGTRFTGRLADFFDHDRLAALRPPGPGGLTIWYGCGAALARPDAMLAYVDLPKNEQQFRARAGIAVNLGLRRPLPPKPAYKRSYFVDWPALNAHKRALAARVEVIVDAQRPEEPAVMAGADLRRALAEMAVNWFRVRPWFEPGPWGGQWCRRHLPALPEAANYAWSFELIAPENGLMVRDADRLLEVSFDWLMFLHRGEVLGGHAGRFGDEFPIRFDFLDTVDGGNLSIQVHPGLEAIRREFGESMAQDEAYYILDAAPGARVHLGFQAGVTPPVFRAALERSARDATPLEATCFVQSHPAAKHDLFLVPHGTIHGSGIGNLVLEISSTPYIFTYKLYDWLRPDLDGRPRPLNIERGMRSLDFSRQGRRVGEELISRPRVVAEASGGVTEHLPTHPDQFYDVWRYHVRREIDARTGGSPHVLNVVDGPEVWLETAGGRRQVFHYAETFVVPAAAGSYRLVNPGAVPVVVVMARLKGG